jgi:hypothetical protein
MASVVGMKRARSMEKCDGCRTKRIKVSFAKRASRSPNCAPPGALAQSRSDRAQCIPTTRVWERGEKCVPCETRGQPCGPNRRAPKSPRKAASNLRPTERVLVPSPPPGSLALAPPPTLGDPASYPMPAVSDCQVRERVLSPVAPDTGQMLFPTLPGQAGASREAVGGSEQNDRITSR